MKKTLQSCLWLLLLLPLTLKAQNTLDGLKVMNPDNAWSKSPATFDKIDITVTPHGNYANVDITFEISAKNTQFANYYDSLEFEYKFTLPHQAHIHAAWLWMNGIPVKAKLYEKAEARFIYETLVSRRVDPLIIYKTTNETYEARIYPGWKSEARKVRMSLLIPVKANSRGIELPLPLAMFRQDFGDESNTPIPIDIKVVNNSFWGPPTPLEQSAILNNGNTTNITLMRTNENIASNYSLYFKNRTMDDVMTLYPETQDEGYFQMFLSPRDSMPGNHYLFVVDYMTSSTYNKVSYQEILKALKRKMLFELTATDSFNIIYTNSGNIASASDHWLAADSTNIHGFMNAFPLNATNTVNQNTNILMKAIQFNNQQAYKGKILIITNSPAQYHGTTDNNSQATALMDAMAENYPLHVVSVSPDLRYDFWIPVLREYTYNNRYLLRNIVAATGGTYQERLLEEIDNYNSSVRALGEVIASSIENMLPKTTFDQLNYSANGLLTNQYLANNAPFSNQKDALLFVGKYYGDISGLSIQRNYQANGIIYQNTITPQINTDSSELTRKIWGANHINDLSRYNSNGVYTGQIVAASKDFEVLSLNTAFLALEPDTVSTMINNGISGIDEHPGAGTLSISCLPNPFTDMQKISVQLSDDLHHQNWTCTVTDITGRILETKSGKTGAGSVLDIMWDGARLSEGIYIINVTIGHKKASLKVVKTR